MNALKTVALTLAAGAMLATGCATTRSVDERIAQVEARTDQRLEAVGGQIEDLQHRQRQQEQRLDEVSKEAQDALRRAEEAGILARGRVVFEEAFSEDRVRFNIASARLSDEARAALDEFASRVKALDRAVWIEIQGHTDSTGSESYNLELGQNRAESVRTYLSQQHAIPLARMSTISYGESAPVASNSTREGRRQNRRVVLVVLE
jgi:peptidoglycan-associated lipoprotein